MSTTKQLVFQTLLKASAAGDFVSGQELAQKCKVSRTAVWKAVNSLIKEGMEIQAVTNRGYKLIKAESVLSKDQLQARIPDNCKVTFEFHTTIDSTNLECKRQCVKAVTFRNADGTLTAEGKKLHQHVVVADSQTAGRGRLGRSFYSPSQSGVYMSMIYIPRNNIVHPARMTATAAVAVCHAIQKIFHIKAKIKWVNDIFINGRKICGILTEGIANFETGGIEAAIVGIGINLCESESGFPEEIANSAGSLLGKKNASMQRSELAAQVALELAEMYEIQEQDLNSPEAKQIMQEYKERTFLIGQTLEISPVINGNEKYFAKAVDVTEEAALVVQKEDGSLVTLQSGEVSLSSKNFIS